jgi:uncharacterized membrane protein YvlD (DUF360 family)
LLGISLIYEGLSIFIKNGVCFWKRYTLLEKGMIEKFYPAFSMSLILSNFVNKQK